MYNVQLCYFRTWPILVLKFQTPSITLFCDCTHITTTQYNFIYYVLTYAMSKTPKVVKWLNTFLNNSVVLYGMEVTFSFRVYCSGVIFLDVLLKKKKKKNV